MQLERPAISRRALPQTWAPASLTGTLRRVRAWEAGALASILAVALYLNAWELSRNGYANEYYSAAVLAATQSWKAFLFGSLDAANFITIDKPPLALWPQALAARIFGLNSWSLLLPQAFIATGSVAVLHRVVRMTAGPIAGLVAALALALSPVSVAVSRDNIPDSLLVFLFLLGAWALLSAVRGGRLLPLILCAVAIGLAFNTKLLQAYMVLPAFALVYAVCAVGSFRARVAKLTMAGAVLIAVSGLWIGVVAATPAGSRPYIGGSTDNSALNLILNYDGLGRLTGADDTPGPGLGNAGPHFGGNPGLTRLFNSQLAGQAGWLIPLALAGIVTSLALAFRRKRTDLWGAGALLWTAWFAVHAGVFSLQQGIFHPYYTAALAPATAALAGIGGVAAWRLSQRHILWAVFAVVAIGSTVLWARNVLGWSPSWHPWLTTLIVTVGIVATAGWLLHAAWRWIAPGHQVAVARREPARWQYAAPALAVLSGAATLVAVLGAPAAYALTPMESAVAGVNPTVGPPIKGNPRLPAVGATATRPTARQRANGTTPAPPPGAFTGNGFAGRGPAVEPGTGANPAVAQFLLAKYGGQRWLAATTDATSAARLMLATGMPVMGMGGFNSTDPAPTLDQLKAYIAAGELRYVVIGGTGGFGLNGRGDRTSWVESHCKAQNVSAYGQAGTERVYDCSAALSRVT